MIRNYAEIVVEEMIDGLIKEQLKINPEICDCEQCREDMTALALNNIPAHYVVSDRGNILKKVSFNLIGGKAQVTSAIINAINTVGANPRHK
jgi:competence protein ComFB